MRRALSALLVAVGITALAVTPAGAARNQFETITSTSSAHTDLREPFKSFTGTDLPVGAWKDERGRLHSSKAYYTVDLTKFRGATFFFAGAWVGETAVTDCTKPIATELWLTDNAEKPTWAKAPKERVGHGKGAAPGCPWDRVEWDVAKVLNDAVAAGKTKLTFALRMPDRHQYDVAYGRRYSSTLRIFTEFNRPPGTPTDMGPCDGAVLHRGQNTLAARLPDPDGYRGLKGKFELWNVNDATKRHSATAEAFTSDQVSVFVPEAFLQDGQTYEWTVQADDGDAQGPVSAPCRFSTDYTAPAAAPFASSPFYPANPPGVGGAFIPGEFVFDAKGDTDIVKFGWATAGGSGRVDADKPGGTAKAMVVPGREGLVGITVFGIDRAGNQSPQATYGFWVAETAPTVTFAPRQPLLGAPVEFSVTPRMTDVVSYTYKFRDEPEQTVPAQPDGSVKITVKATSQFDSSLTVWSTNRDGIRSMATEASFRPLPSEPEVGNAGDVFTFEPRMHGVTEYRYSFDFGDPQSVPAGPDGKATLTIPAEAGEHYLDVWSVNADGVISSIREYYWVKD